MLKTLYDAIQKDATPVILNVDGRNYSDKKLEPVFTPEPASLMVRTLTGLVDYLKTNVDGLKIENLLCHVESPSSVAILSGLEGPFHDRGSYIRAALDQIELPFNKWMDGESFNIALQACFEDHADRGVVLKYVSDVVATTDMAISDDGASQAVTVRSGITSKSVKALPNPVTLRPFRTFTEVPQPVSNFVFRCRQNGNKMEYTLVEADGGAWRGVAMKSIKEYMEKAVPGLNVIA